VSAWQYRNFRLLFIGRTTSALGNTLVPVALAFAVLDLTHSASDLGYVLGAESLALVAFLLPGGVMADRLPRRGVIIASDLARALAQTVLGIVLIAGHPSVATVASWPPPPRRPSTPPPPA
jgi:MFS family permease